MATNRKPRIGIVCGAMSNPRSMQSFTNLSSHYDMAMFAIDHNQFVSGYRGSIPLHVFENLKDMPGYMRALEDYISEFDLLIGVESSRLSTFQMIRIAAKNQTPTAVMVNEFHPYFYNNYPNIRAIQVDVLEHAMRFWPTSRLSESMLRVEGVSEDKIKRIPPVIDLNKFKPDETCRKKFRDHIGASEDSIVILAHRELEKWTYAEELLHAFRLLYVTNPNLAPRLKLLFVGDGSIARDLKYRCYDLNLGKSIMFIHQKSEAFAGDMYAASDFVFCPRRQRAEYHCDFPYQDLEAIASGAIPIFKMGSLIAEYLDDTGVPLPEVNFQTIADGLAGVLNKPGGLKRVSKASLAKILEVCDPYPSEEVLKQEIDQLLSVSRKMRAAANSASDKIEGLLERIRRGEEQEPLIKIEEFLLDTDLHASVRSHLLTEKAVILNQAGRLEEAFESFHDSVRLDEENIAAYRGLGFLSLKSHSHEESISFFKKALSRDDKDVESMFGVGMVHRRLGLNDEALYWLERCLTVDPSNQKVKTALAQTCLDCHSPNSAIASLERVQGQIGEEAGLMLTLGQLYLREGKAEIGNELVSKALDLQQRDEAS